MKSVSTWPPLWSSGQRSWLQNGDVLCLLCGTNWIYVYYVEESVPPLWSNGQRFWLQNGDVLCFLWGTNWIYICYVEKSRPPLWSNGQSSSLQIQRSRFDSRRMLSTQDSFCVVTTLRKFERWSSDCVTNLQVYWQFRCQHCWGVESRYTPVASVGKNRVQETIMKLK
jgi:hypothetical protein